MIYERWNHLPVAAAIVCGSFTMLTKLYNSNTFVEFTPDASNLRLTIAPNIVILWVNFSTKQQEFFISTYDLNDVITELVERLYLYWYFMRTGNVATTQDLRMTAYDTEFHLLCERKYKNEREKMK